MPLAARACYRICGTVPEGIHDTSEDRPFLQMIGPFVKCEERDDMGNKQIFK
jgi:hypothetical protein